MDLVLYMSIISCVLSLLLTRLFDKAASWGSRLPTCSFASGGGDSASGVGVRAAVTIKRGMVVFPVEGRFSLIWLSSTASGALRRVEIVCQIATRMVKLHMITTIMRITSAEVGIISIRK